MTTRIDQKKIERIRSLNSEGKSRKEIAEALKISVSSISKYLKDQSGSSRNGGIRDQDPDVHGEQSEANTESITSGLKKGAHESHEGFEDSSTAIRIPESAIERLEESILSALRLTISDSMDSLTQRFTPENVIRFLKILIKEEEENSEIAKLQDEINRLQKVREGIDSEILDSIMRMSAIESRILSLEKRLGPYLSRENEEE